MTSYLVAGTRASPYTLRFFKYVDGQFVLLPDATSDFPSDFIPYKIYFSEDGDTLLVVGNFIGLGRPGILIYQRNGDSFTRIPVPDFPGCESPIWGSIRSGKIILDDRTSDRFAILEISDGVVSYIGDVIHGKTGISDGDLSPNGNLVAMGFSGSTADKLHVYKWDGTTYQPFFESTGEIPNTARSVGFSPDGSFLLVTHTGAPHYAVFQLDGDNFVKMTGLPPLTGYGTTIHDQAISKESQKIALSLGAEPSFTVLRWDNTKFVRMADQLNRVQNRPITMSFFNEGDGLALSFYSDYRIEVYSVTGSRPVLVQSIPTPNASTAIAISPNVENPFIGSEGEFAAPNLQVASSVLNAPHGPGEVAFPAFGAKVVSRLTAFGDGGAMFPTFSALSEINLERRVLGGTLFPPQEIAGDLRFSYGLELGVDIPTLLTDGSVDVGMRSQASLALPQVTAGGIVTDFTFTPESALFTHIEPSRLTLEPLTFGLYEFSGPPLILLDAAIPALNVDMSGWMYYPASVDLTLPHLETDFTVFQNIEGGGEAKMRPLTTDGEVDSTWPVFNGVGDGVLPSTLTGGVVDHPIVVLDTDQFPAMVTDGFTHVPFVVLEGSTFPTIGTGNLGMMAGIEKDIAVYVPFLWDAPLAFGPVRASANAYWSIEGEGSVTFRRMTFAAEINNEYPVFETKSQVRIPNLSVDFEVVHPFVVLEGFETPTLTTGKFVHVPFVVLEGFETPTLISDGFTHVPFVILEGYDLPALSVEALLAETWKIDANTHLPALEIAAGGGEPVDLYSESLLPHMEASLNLHVFNTASAAIELLGLDSTGVGSIYQSASADFSAPPFDVAADLKFRYVENWSFGFPTLQTDGFVDRFNQVDANLDLLGVQFGAEIRMYRTLSGAYDLPVFDLDAGVEQRYLIRPDLTLGAAMLDGGITLRNPSFGHIEVAPFLVAADGVLFNQFSADPIFPAIVAGADIRMFRDLVGEIDFEPLMVEGESRFLYQTDADLLFTPSRIEGEARLYNSTLGALTLPPLEIEGLSRIYNSVLGDFFLPCCFGASGQAQIRSSALQGAHFHDPMSFNINSPIRFN